jgi:hypothetical protein
MRPLVLHRRFSNAKVGQLRPTTGVKQNVPGLQVAVNHTALMRILQSL